MNSLTNHNVTKMKQQNEASSPPTDQLEPGLACNPYPDIRRDTIIEVICQRCQKCSGANNGQEWSFRCATTEDFGRSGWGSVDEHRLHGFVASRLKDDGHTSYLATFFVSYSTWEGRVLYQDYLGQHQNNAKIGYSEKLPVDVTLLLQQTLAMIACDLHCSRFTWNQYANDPSAFEGHPNHQPEFHDGLLTIYWNAPQFQHYMYENISEMNETLPHDTLESRQMIMKRCLKAVSHPCFDVRLATENDVDDVRRLVQELATHVNEPDAVRITTEHYRRDGFGDIPLFYAVLLTERNGQESAQTCGLATFYLGNSLSGGLFLHLEDLFIERANRGKGAGSLCMRALATIAGSISCNRITWQALVRSMNYDNVLAIKKHQLC